MNINEISDISSESGIIGTLLIKPEYIAHIDFLKANHFSSIENASIYWSMKELFSEGIAVFDAFNINNKLESHKGIQKKLEKFNLPSIQELIDLYIETARTSTEELKMLAKNVVNCAFKRELVKKLNITINDCFNPEISLEKISNTLYSDLDKLVQNFTSDEELKTIGDDIDDVWNEIEERRNGNGNYGLPSKYSEFNKYFNYENGELVVIQARMKRGKSVLIMNEVIHKLKNGVPTLVIDTEMSKRLYVERLISHLSGVDLNRVKSGKYSQDEANKINDARIWLKKAPLVHRYMSDPDLEKVYSICKILKNKIGLGFVAYDYLKCNEGSSSDIYNKLGAMTDFLKNRIAGELDLPVLSAAQLNRLNEIADSDKINRHLSVCILWGYKTQEQIAKNGIKCGNALAKITLNRLGEQMDESNEDDYIDFQFDGNIMSISEAEQHQHDECDDF